MPSELATQLVRCAAEVEDAAAESAERVIERADRIARNPELRDELLCELAADELGLDPDVLLAADLDDLEGVPVSQRDAEWRELFAAVIGLSRLQALHDEGLIREQIEIAERYAQAINRRAERMSLSAVQQAARIGVAKGAVESAIEERRAARAALMEAVSDAADAATPDPR